MLERYLIEHCAPTLASLKTANLFTYHYDNGGELSEHLAEWNLSFKSKGKKDAQQLTLS